MDVKYQRLKYISTDVIASVLSWTLVWYLSTIYIFKSSYIFIHKEFTSNLFIFGLIVYSSFWILIYYLQGTYTNVYRKSRLQELAQSFIAALIGSTILFLIIIAEKALIEYSNFYFIYYFLFFSQLLFSYIPRSILTNINIWKLRTRRIGFNTLLAGSNGKAIDIYHHLEKSKQAYGYRFLGFISVVQEPSEELKHTLLHLGNANDVAKVIREKEIQEIIIATEKRENREVGTIIAEAARQNVVVKIIPDLYDYLVGRVKLSHLYDLPLIEVNQLLLPEWQLHLKRLIDVLFSIIALMVLSPLFLFIAVGVKMSSKGAVFYSHERIGRFGKAFHIYKFRSMYLNAEAAGPALASKNDPRITSFGRFLRKTRLDELPQFYNVLRGEMSLVGPRPERQFYIDKIVQQAPHYQKLQRIRPGITSWGQVRYGYAENVEEMLERLNFDLVYLDNISLYTDLKILIYTVFIMLKGNGR